MVKKIVILGPESTGKSTLCQQLAEHYKTTWCPEYAREYLLENRGKPSFNDLLTIAKRQIGLEEKFSSNAKSFYFIDTDMYVMKVWCEVEFNNCHTWILKQAAARDYHLHLLCDVDIPWVKDELREYPDLAFRKRLFKMYHDILINGRSKWAVVSGSYTERLSNAIRIIDALFESKNV